MKRAVLASVLVSSVAVAQPITTPAQTAEPCRVRVVLAPDDVRAQIEAWVRAEPRCVRELEVRVVPTHDGLYISAADRDGHVRERVVPDAQSAAVLVVSWMADDSLGPSFPAAVGPSLDEEATPVEREPAPPTRDAEAPPPVLESFDGAPLSSHHRETKRYLTLGAIAGVHDDRMRGDVLELGARGQLDLWSSSHWYLGLSGDIREHDGGAHVVIGAQQAFGRASVRIQLGFGGELGRVDDHDNDALLMEEPRVMPSLELGLFGRFNIDRHWAAVGGPVIEASPDSHVRPSIFIGVQHDL